MTTHPGKTSSHLLFLCIVVLTLLAPCKTTAQPKQPETWITVFVHGIMSIKPHVNFSNFFRFMTDNVENTVYFDTVTIMRNNPLYYQNQAMQEIGLKKIDLTPHAGNASGAMAIAFELLSSFVEQENPVLNHYYTSGWSGILSQKARYKAARDLYQDLVKLTQEFIAQGIVPKIRLIGYSHGGNVLLNLASVSQDEPSFPPLTINELILLGMPVQKETDHLINHAIFDSIIHIYSLGDRVQQLDLFSVNRFFSGRMFKPRKGFPLPDKLIQVQLKCTRNSCFSASNDKKIALGYDFRHKSIISGKSRYLRDASPGHSELWFFSWTPSNYRENFPLNPLPAAALIPLIIREARNFTDKRLIERPTLIDIRPQHELIIVKNKESKQTLTIAQFLPLKEQEKIGKIILQYAPLTYTKEQYNGGIQAALQHAKSMWSDQQQYAR